MRGLILSGLFVAITAFCQSPVISDNGTVNAASFASGQQIAPGSLAAVFGTDLAGTLTLADSIPLAAQLADVRVTFNDIPAPLLAAIPGTPSQVNAQVPWRVLPPGVTSGQATVIVFRGNSASPPKTVQVGASAPGIFAYPFGVGQAIAVLQTNDQRNGSLAAPVGAIAGVPCAPAVPGDFIQIYATGLGPVDIPVADGAIPLDQLRRTLANPTILIGGIRVTPTFSGLSPYFVGVNQVNVQVPANAPRGDAIPLQIEAGGITTTSQVTIAIQ
jgi:uncharacterized protein (TIGR03437 family)